MNPAAPSEARARLDAIVKAYDVRGIVGDGLTAESRRGPRRGASSTRSAPRGPRSSSATTCATPRPASPPPSRGAPPAAAPTSSPSGSARPTRRYFASGSMNAPAAMFTASHNPAAYNGIKFSPRRRPGHLLDTGSRRSATAPATTSTQGITVPRRRGTVTRAGRARRLRGVPALARRPLRHPPAEGRRRRRQRHGRAHRPRRARRGRRPPALPLEIVPLYFELDGTFPNHEANPLEPGEPRRPAGAPWSSTAPTSGSPSTATPTAASSSTSRAAR